jgi:ABC-type polysaccharide/polyol phosphate transport system ATPase subunit
MSPENAVEIEAISKRFKTFRSSADQIVEMATLGLVRRHREHRALDDISFSVRRGECVGILGTNGSGKSTLLQIVAGTMRPTSGQVMVRGRVAALLELGAGFAPDFTGRENALMSARLLGCTEAEALAALPHIIAFSGIGDFIDRPVRTYSSGMYVRLAFATAAAASPDVFIIDEALAVGDRVFQGRCYARLRELRKGGTTILFVSHDLASVSSFCDRAVWIEKGHLRSVGDVREVVADYVAGTRDASPAPVGSSGRTGDALVLRPGTALALLPIGEQAETPDVRISAARMEVSGETVEITVDAVVHRDVADPDLSISVKDIRGTTLYGTGTSLEGRRIGPVRAGDGISATFRMELPLRGDVYPVAVAVSDGCHSGPHLPLDAIEDRLFVELSERRKTRHLLDIQAEVEVVHTVSRTAPSRSPAQPRAAA